MLKPFDEMLKVDVSPYIDQRDGADYLNWAKCVELLHENGAETVRWEALTNEHGSSLFMSDIPFKDKNGVENRCYEVAVKVTIDDKEYIQRAPVMNGANPVKDNSMSQQRVYNAQVRAFVKCVAINTGLGFKLWSRTEAQEEKSAMDGDLSKHSLAAIKRRLEELVTAKMQSGMTLDDLAKGAGLPDGETLRSYFGYFKILDQLERKIESL